jgi:hypothetical protein
VFLGLGLAAAAFPGCTSTALPQTAVAPEPRAADPESLHGLINQYAAAYDVPPALVHRVVKRESNYNPKAYSKGNWGLMQIRHATARGMGYDGPAKGLLNAETNLNYAVKYLRGAYLVAGGNHDQAVRLYQRGYYYDAKRKGLLEETGLVASKKKVAEVETIAAAPVEDAAQVTALPETPVAATAEARPAAEVPASTIADAAAVVEPAASAAPITAADAAPAAASVSAMSFAGGTATTRLPGTFQVPTGR